MRMKLAPLTLLVLALVGCKRTEAPAVTESPFAPKASIRELMEAEVDPAADAIWDSVAVIVSASGEEDKQPRTPQEWQAVRRQAVILFESTNLLVMQGRRIAPAGAHYPQEADPEVLQKRLDANRAPLIGFAEALRNESLKALDAIDAKDPERLLDAGGKIDEACEACHLVYWYPPDLTPN